MKLKEAFDKSVQFLKDKGSQSARLDVELLFSHVLQIKKIDIYLQFDRPLSEIESQNLRDVIVRRGKLEPVAYIIEAKDFFKTNFKVGPGVLIPRPETESLVEFACEWGLKKKKNSLSILDLGAGSGCIGISIVKEFLENGISSKLTSVEKSKEAFAFLQHNVDQLMIQQKKQIEDKTSIDFEVEILNHDVQAFVVQNNISKFDLVVANPPYIDVNDLEVDAAVKSFEPHLALFADEKGLSYIKSWSAALVPHLLDQALMIFEIGYKQGESAKKIFSEYKQFSKVEILKDLSGKDRFVKGETRG